jgi:hypothetical protein
MLTNFPEDKMIASIQESVIVMGLVVVLFYPIIFSMSESHDNIMASMSSYELKVLSGLIVYSAFVFLIGGYGESTKQWVIDNPDELVTLIISVMSIAILLYFIHLIQRAYSGLNGDIGIGADFMRIRRNDLPVLSEQDKEYIAAHESGHVLVYAALGSLPHNMEVVLKSECDNEGSLGYVSGIASKHKLSDKVFSEWSMLVLLAGQFGETFAFRKSTLGSTNDFRKWRMLAISYLENHYGGIYYLEPKNKFEHESNEEKLNALHAKQKELLEMLFRASESSFNCLRSALLDKGVLVKDDLLPILGQAVIPAGFPLPLGEFDEFGGEWPGSSGFYVRSKTGRG